ncbi:hypothetical protein DL96DRAFT_1613607 [Flagelloscypha sp. PMI_526]|nr:hypothetical protein DL96DRAFT_1613607 [Flagelloscypha sp. PMI_526]
MATFLTTPHPNDCERVENLWFNDGSIILLTGTRVFRIYREDMFSLPQPYQSDDIFEGCPVIRLPEDSDELEWYLLAIFDSTYLDRLVHDSTASPIPALLGVARLSHKYDSSILKKTALRQIQLYYPSSLKSFMGGKPGGKSLSLSLPAHWCMPSACYLIGRDYLPENIVPLLADDPPLLAHLVRGCRYQDAYVYRVIHSIFENEADCEGRDCVLARIAGSQAFTHLWLDPMRAGKRDPIGMMRSFTMSDVPSACHTCCSRYIEDRNSVEADIWEELPSIYALPNWEILETRKKNALA